MTEGIKHGAEQHMKKSLEVLHNEFVKIRTGRAHPSLLDHVMVPYYGNKTPLNQIASITICDPRTLLVSPWEKTIVPVIEKAILQANLGLNPVVVGQILRIPLPALTEERRKELVRVVRGEAENTRVAIRNIRRDAIAQIKELSKDKSISEDEEHREQDNIQKLTDRLIKKIDEILSEKERELMAV